MPPDVQAVLNGPLGEYMANLASDLTLRLLHFVSAPLRKRLRPDPQQTAIQQALAYALATAFADQASDPTLFRHTISLFQEWAERDEVARQLAQLIDARPESELDLSLLQAEFEAAGYTPDALGAGVDFVDRAQRLARAFYDAAAAHPDLRDPIQIGLLRRLVGGLAGVQTAAERSAGAAEATHALLQQEQERPDALRHYLQSLRRQCEVVDVAALDEAVVHSRDAAVSLSAIYTTLYVERHGRPLTCAPHQTVQAALLGAAPEQTTRDADPQPISAVAVLGALPRVVVLGRPGSGKSTLVNYLAGQLARRGLGEDVPLEEWPDAAPVPVRIILRRFAAWLPVSPPPDLAGLVWDYIHTLVGNLGCGDVFPVLQRALRQGQGVVFFDGLDEVYEADAAGKRSLITDAIQAFTQPLTGGRVVITCREYAYRPGQGWRLPETDFPIVELGLFTETQIRAFTAAWYGEIGPLLKGWTPQEARRQAEDLAHAVLAWPQLYELGQYPLLLTLMAQVHGRDGTLPNDRAELYDRAVNLLLSHWESRVEREQGQQPLPGLIARLGVRRDVLRSALGRVALRAHERQEEKMGQREARPADVTRHELWDILKAELGSYDQAQKVTDYIQERAGLLQAQDHDTYTFPHRSFQEYLAAAALWEGANPEEALRDRVRRNPVWWREVFLLALGMKRATPSSVAAVVETLLPDRAGRPVTPEPVVWAQLAAEAFSETGFDRHVAREANNPYPERFTLIFRRTYDWLETALTADAVLTPPARATAGEALARLGDERRGVGVRAGLPDIVWCYVPPGPFWLGSDASDRQADSMERPADWYDIPYPYWIARYQVTTAQWRAFVTATRYRLVDPKSLWGSLNQPATSVRWWEAIKFSYWLTEAWRVADSLPQGYAIRLPNEPEWEKAARGGRRVPTVPLLRLAEEGLAFPTDHPQRDHDRPRRRYPWGNDPALNCANDEAAGIGAPSPVGIFPAGQTPYGALDMSGNVFEWTRSLYRRYPYQPNDGREDETDRPVRVQRGGAYLSSPDRARCAFRHWLSPPHGRGEYTGFRVVVSPVAVGR